MSSSVEVGLAPGARARELTLLRTAMAQLETVVTQLEQMAVAQPWSAVGYFEAADHTRMEHFFFRFLVSRQVLVSLAQHAQHPPLPRPYQKLVDGAVGLSASVKSKMSETKAAQLLLVEAENVKTKMSETKAAQLLLVEAPLLLEGATENVKTKISDTTAKLRAYTTTTASTTTTTTTTSTLEDANHVENDEENDDNDNDKHDSESDHEDEDNDNDEDKSSSSVRVALTAGYAALYYECRLVHAFQDDPVAVDQLNQKFNRSEIARDTFRQLQLDCTDTTRQGRLESLDHAYHCYAENDQALSTYFDDNVVDDELLPDLYAKTKTLTTALVGTTFQYISLENKVQQTTLAKNTYRAKRTTGDLLKKIRAHTYKGVSRLKSPTAYLIQFSAAQKRDIFASLQPGDLVFTYTAGYMSSIFIPGHFKHGITYIGSPDARRMIGLTAETLATCCHTNDEGATLLPTTTAEQRKLLAQFEVSTASLDANLSADVIEAVAEGVIFNNLEHLMDTHVNRFLVLRPKITAAERIHALMDIFRYLGASYDFSFSFADTSCVVCTEIMYHAFTGKGAIDFALVDHAGHLSLSADE